MALILDFTTNWIRNRDTSATDVPHRIYPRRRADQAYFTALLVLSTIGAPMNPGNPYLHSKTQVGFSTFGQRILRRRSGRSAARALDVVWYHKWLVHLRHRPESGGGIVQLMQTDQGNTINAHVNNNVLNSQAVQSSFSKYGSYLLSQAFPEGSPTHPAYPTGHGVVGGRLHHLAEVFLRRQFRDPQSTGTHQRRSLTRALHRWRCRPDYRRRRTQQASRITSASAMGSTRAYIGAATRDSSMVLGRSVGDQHPAGTGPGATTRSSRTSFRRASTSPA